MRLLADKVAFAPDTKPVPFNTTNCGLSGALSVIVRVAFRGPICVGLKTTPIVQLAPGARGDLQVQQRDVPESSWIANSLTPPSQIGCAAEQQCN